VLVATAQGETAASFTSGRSTLVEHTARVFVHNPLVGVGIGAQAKEVREEGGRRETERNASHTTPLTVAAELGAVGIVAYLALLAGAVRLLTLVLRRERALGLVLGSAFLLLFVHALFYSGFFENPTVWGILAVGASALATVPEPAAIRAPAPAPVQPVAPGEAPTAP
jgi:O-antigen ligase